MALRTNTSFPRKPAIHFGIARPCTGIYVYLLSDLTTYFPRVSGKKHVGTRNNKVKNYPRVRHMLNIWAIGGRMIKSIRWAFVMSDILYTSADSITLHIVNWKFAHLENTSLTQVHYLKDKSSEADGRISWQTSGTHKFVSWLEFNHEAHVCLVCDMFSMRKVVNMEVSNFSRKVVLLFIIFVCMLKSYDWIIIFFLR